jgi:hypothetical protein
MRRQLHITGTYLETHLNYTMITTYCPMTYGVAKWAYECW